MVQSLRTLAFVALVALASGTATADSRRADERAGQTTRAPKATQELRRQLWLERVALRKGQLEWMRKVRESDRIIAQEEAEKTARDADPR